MNRKRERPNQSGNHYPKRRRPSVFQFDTADDSTSILGTTSSAVGKQQNTVVVNGLPTDCSVLDLKSRFEIYGSISRTRIDPNGLAYITFRSHDSANSAVSAALDSSFRLTVLSKQVQVMWASDPVPKWREGVAKKVGVSSVPLSSRLVRAEVPLSRRGRENGISHLRFEQNKTKKGRRRGPKVTMLKSARVSLVGRPTIYQNATKLMMYISHIIISYVKMTMMMMIVSAWCLVDKGLVSVETLEM